MIQAIQELLTQGGRAIIPGIGCLSVNDEGKTVFNAFLTFNDGRMVSWLVQNKGLDEIAALSELQNWAANLKSHVLAGNDFVLGNIGKFVLEGKDEIEFTTDLSSQVTPSVHVEPETKQDPLIEQELLPVIEDKSEPILTEQVNEVVQVSEDIQDKQIDNQPADLEQIKSIEQEGIAVAQPSKSLDDILNKPSERETVNAETQFDNAIPLAVSAPEVDQISIPEQAESVPKDIIEDKPQTIPEPMVETVENQQIEVKVEEPIIEEKFEKTPEKSENKSEEVTYKRKRGVFFFINVGLIILILGVGTFALIFTDEFSAMLGISTTKTEKVKDKEQKSQSKSEESKKDSTKREKEVTQDTVVQPAMPAQELEQPKKEEHKKEEPKKVEPKKEPVANIPAVASGGTFFIIVGKFAVKENADRLVKKIRDSGYDGKILRSTDTGHTVSFHSYPTMQDAQSNIEKAKEITGTKAYIEEKK